MWWILGALFVVGFVVLAGGGLAFFLLRKRPAAVEDDDFGPPPSARDDRDASAPPPPPPEDIAASEPASEPPPPPDVAPAPTHLPRAEAPAAEAQPAFEPRRVAARPTIVAEPDLPPEPPAVEPPASAVAPPAPAPAVEPPAPPVALAPVAPPPAPAPEAPEVFEHLQKMRVADTDLVLRAYAAHFPGEELLAFVAEGGDARPDFVLYVRPAGDRDEQVRAGLKFFSFVLLKLGIDRLEPAPGKLLPYAGHIGALSFAGFLVVEQAAEPAPVPLARRWVLLAVPKALAGRDAADVAAELGVSDVGAPYVSEAG